MKGLIKTLLLGVGILVYSVCYMAFNPEVLFVRKYSTVTQQDIKKNQDKDYRGYKAGEDIIRLKSNEQLQEAEGYVTVETDTIIPLDLYVVKSFDVMNELISQKNTSTRRGRRYGGDKAPKPYLKSLGADKTHHNRAYLIQLEDGSYVTALMEDYYANKIQEGKTVTLPIAEVDHLQKEMKGPVNDYSEKYEVNDQDLLRFYNETAYEETYLWLSVSRIVVGLLGAAIYLIIISMILPKGLKFTE